MKATITMQGGVKIEVDTTFDEIMRIANESRASVFIPACLCHTTNVCSQHPRPLGVIPRAFPCSVPELIR